MGFVLAAGALVVGAVAEAAPTGAGAKGPTPTAAPAVGSLAWPSVPAHPSTALQHDFAEAAAEFHVPVQVLLAVSYEETLWESHGGRPSTTGNYNVMGLTQVSPGDLSPTVQPDVGGPGDGAAAHRPSAAALKQLRQVDTASPALHTLQTAAALAGVPAKRLRTDMKQSVRGGAALLACYEAAASAGGHGLPTDPARWWPAVVAYAQAETPAAGQQFAARVYAVVQQGASRLTDDNQQLTLPASPSVQPAQLAGALAALAVPGSGSECPSGLACAFTPAAYRQDAKASATDYGNYAQADRPTDGDGISYLVLHATQGSRDGAIAFFQDPAAYASAHYLVGRDGSVTQLVPTKDIAWHTGNRTLNAHSIGVEQEGFALRTGSWYTEAEYQSSAALIRYLAARFGIPLDREHLLGRDDVPAPVQAGRAVTTHGDPGPYWDWSHLLDLVGAPLTGLHAQPVVGGTVTVAPPYDRTTQPDLTGCGSPTRACPSHPADFVYLRTAPSASAPLLGGGGTAASDVSDKAGYGQTFVVAGVASSGSGGDWVGVWYGGQEAWFEDPSWRDTLVPDPTPGAALTLVTPTGDQPIPVYGRAYPESSAYPAPLASLAASSAQALTPLAATIAPGQAYLAAGQLSGDFYAANYGCAGATGCAMVIGATQYYPIRFDHRLAFVRASDVQLIGPASLPTATPTR
ncbi:N-acetylmuramoyl-L-alanine amidase [Streptacidiphilus pinicola]|uniref:N-acetylmuramoyl-L-alanine amidase n=1 Tax=Streptacidiphilus pinicola TaxID=2219663 RepID=A0A2X0KBG2_9ACTN|nr:peptidoglycan recognition family protein [Streptacidiphilus pinicola]RAG84370.1 N-acetylmuramoyl-L-alanine amidase [Streptacidiphilus pinicola]